MIKTEYWLIGPRSSQMNLQPIRSLPRCYVISCRGMSASVVINVQDGNRLNGLGDIQRRLVT